MVDWLIDTGDDFLALLRAGSDVPLAAEEEEVARRKVEDVAKREAARREAKEVARREAAMANAELEEARKEAEEAEEAARKEAARKEVTRKRAIDRKANRAATAAASKAASRAAISCLPSHSQNGSAQRAESVEEEDEGVEDDIITVTSVSSRTGDSFRACDSKPHIACGAVSGALKFGKRHRSAPRVPSAPHVVFLPESLW